MRFSARKAKPSRLAALLQLVSLGGGVAGVGAAGVGVVGVGAAGVACESQGSEPGRDEPGGVTESEATAGGGSATTSSSAGTSTAGTSTADTSTAGTTGATLSDTSTADTSAAGATGTSTTSEGALPEGGQGIAAQYPSDEAIETSPEVLFADGFESYTGPSDLNQRWDAVYQSDQIRLATESELVRFGSQSLEFSVPQQDAELSNATDKVLTDEQDVLFLRYYSRFQAPFEVVGSSHNGSMISAHYFINGQATPGVPADGTNKFLVNLENWRGEAETPSPGLLNVYVYHPEQRSEWGDHFFPSGLVQPNTSIAFDFGPNFAARREISIELDRWYCYEYMLRANTPGERDGRIAVWLDGELVADFQNLRFRDVASLKIDRFGLSFHIGSNPTGETKKWYDNVVAATAYIGPLLAP